jgi:hypothetical protein
MDLLLARASRPRGGRFAQVLTVVGGLVLVVLVAFLLGGMLSMRRMLAAGVRKVTNTVVQDLPQGLPRQRCEQVQRRLDCVVEEARAGRLDDRKLGEFIRTCRDAVAHGRVGADELREIESRAIALCVASGGEIR